MAWEDINMNMPLNWADELSEWEAPVQQQQAMPNWGMDDGGQQQQQQQQQQDPPGFQSEPPGTMARSISTGINNHNPQQHQQQQQQQQQQFKQQQEPETSHYATIANTASIPTASAAIHSGVDGAGMWKSWCHNYNDPKYACFDLLDNCFDATLKLPNFHGKVTMNYLMPNGLVITNNSAGPIKPLSETLTAYRSEKNSEGVVAEIGEYGVGLKQACATLTDTSFVVTRNKNQFDIGIIAKKLQTINSVLLPNFPFQVSPSTEPEALIVAELKQQITNIMKANPDIYNILTYDTFGEGSRTAGIDKLVEHCKDMYLSDQWKDQDYVFQLIITKFKHTTDESARNGSGMMQQPAKVFLEDIREMLPKQYINIPLKDFDFTIDNERVQFLYWQNRLVEMTKFEVHIPKEDAIENLPETGWQSHGYPLSIYCGFDALRLADKKLHKTCQLCIYSRQSGRLIEVTKDARAMLGMGTSGVDYSQGLTVIIDDVEGELPLKPTKDGLTWSKEAAGETHQSNLMAWTGAVGKMYWRHHAQLFEKTTTEWKKKMGKVLLSFVQPIENRIQQQKQLVKENIPVPGEDSTRLEESKFTMFSDVNWHKHQTKAMKLVIQKKTHKVDTWPGPATVFRFQEKHYRVPTEAKAKPKKPVKPKARTSLTSVTGQKRRASSISVLRRGSSQTSQPSVPPANKRRTSAASQQPLSEDSSSGSEEEQEVGVIASPNLTKKMMTPTPIARKRSSTTNPLAGLITPLHHGEETTATAAAGESGKTKGELEEALRSSQAENKKLRALNVDARKTLLAARKADPGGFERKNAEDALLAQRQLNVKLQEAKEQLEQNLRELEEKRKLEAAKAQRVIQQLQLELQQKTQGGNGFHLGGGTDFI